MVSPLMLSGSNETFASLVLEPLPVLSRSWRIDYFWFLRRTISLLDLAFLLRVLRPSAGLPHGVDGDLRPTGCLPSPPPCG